MLVEYKCIVTSTICISFVAMYEVFNCTSPFQSNNLFGIISLIKTILNKILLPSDCSNSILLTTEIKIQLLVKSASNKASSLRDTCENTQSSSYPIESLSSYVGIRLMDFMPKSNQSLRSNTYKLILI